MTNEETLANVQVAHLFLKAADMGIIANGAAEEALHELFPHINPAPEGDLRAIVRELLAATDHDASAARYSLNVNTALAKLRVHVGEWGPKKP